MYVLRDERAINVRWLDWSRSENFENADRFCEVFFGPTNLKCRRTVCRCRRIPSIEFRIELREVNSYISSVIISESFFSSNTVQICYLIKLWPWIMPWPRRFNDILEMRWIWIWTWTWIWIRPLRIRGSYQQICASRLNPVSLYSNQGMWFWIINYFRFCYIYINFFPLNENDVCM